MGSARGGRLLVYIDVAYRRDHAGFSTDRAFLKLVLELRSRFDPLVLVGRVRPGRSGYAIPEDVEVIALPDYPTLRHLLRVLQAVPHAMRVLWSEVGRAETVLAIGPHPLSLPTALFAVLRRRPLTLMVRQNYPEYIRHRLPSARWKPFVAIAEVSDRVFRLLGRHAGVVVVGDELAEVYQSASRLLSLSISLMPEAAHGSHRGSAGGDELRLLAVTRLEPEKAPHLLIEATALLAQRHPDRRVQLTLVGAGELRDELEALAHAIAPGQVSFVGYVPHGEPLFDLYRAHDVLVHAAKTEGVPQVVVEAQFVGLPVVATDVGGVRGAVADGKSALLVPPGSAEALADAVDAITADDELRARLVDRGLAGTSGVTLQRQADRLAGFISSAAS